MSWNYEIFNLRRSISTIRRKLPLIKEEVRTEVERCINDIDSRITILKRLREQEMKPKVPMETKNE